VKILRSGPVRENPPIRPPEGHTFTYPTNLRFHWMVSEGTRKE